MFHVIRLAACFRSRDLTLLISSKKDFITDTPIWFVCLTKLRISLRYLYFKN